MSDEIVAQVLRQISQLPKPLLVHCDSAIRSAALALIHTATQRGATLVRQLNKLNNWVWQEC